MASDGDNFGWAVAADGMVVVGATFADDKGINSGSVYFLNNRLFSQDSDQARENLMLTNDIRLKADRVLPAVIGKSEDSDRYESRVLVTCRL